ncbi:hypothetical protein ACFPRL_21985 [Pseudoclavibacter helvolus]
MVTTDTMGRETDGISSCLSEVIDRPPKRSTQSVTRAISARFLKLISASLCTPSVLHAPPTAAGTPLSAPRIRDLGSAQWEACERRAKTEPRRQLPPCRRQNP